MSRLVLKGNTLSNTGEYFPSVYIDKIYLNDHGIAVDASVFVPHKEDANVYAMPDGATPDEEAYVNEMDSDVYYYVAILLNTEVEDGTVSSSESWLSGDSFCNFSGGAFFFASSAAPTSAKP